MKTSDLSIKELAAGIRVSTDTIRRAVRNGEIPSTRVGTALRFDLREVSTYMQWNAEARFGARSTRVGGDFPCVRTNPLVLKHGGKILNKNNVVVPTGFEPVFKP